MTNDDRLSAWSGRTDPADGEKIQRWHHAVRTVEASDAAGIALAGFASDAGVSRNQGRPGAAQGPGELRRAMSNLAWHGNEHSRLYDAGDVRCVDGDLESAQREYAALLARLLTAGHFPLGLGGGHEIAWAAYQGLAAAMGDDPRMARLGIVNFDAHLDLRTPEVHGRGTSGTPFLQIAEARAAGGQPFRYLCIGVNPAANTRALFDRADSLGVEIVLDTDIVGSRLESVHERIGRFIDGCSAVYLTFCLDVLPAAVAPGVSAPAAPGISAHSALELLRAALHRCRPADAASKLLLADVAELNPTLDPDGRTARMAARVVYEIARISP